jgi:hypothetical protein
MGRINSKLDIPPFCLLFPDGRPLETHRAFENSRTGYVEAKQPLLDTIAQQTFDGMDISGEATSYYWLPFFFQMEIFE